jgi:DNA-binding YbaB/EbfC family protein
VDTIDDLLAQAQAQQERVMEAQRSLERMDITGEAGNGEVTVRLKGSGRFTEIAVDPGAHRRYDADSLGALVLEAVNDGLRNLGEASRRKFEPLMAEAALAPADLLEVDSFDAAPASPGAPSPLGGEPAAPLGGDPAAPRVSTTSFGADPFGNGSVATRPSAFARESG